MARFLVKASEFKNVCKAVNDRKLAELKKEIIEILKKQDEKEVKKAIDYFNSQELHYTHLEKSLNGKWIEKAGYGVGTVRIWKGKKYKKIAPGKWARVFEKEGRGTNVAVGRLIAQIGKIDNIEDLEKFVAANKQRFVDENGADLPVVEKIKAAADSRNGNVGSKEKTVEDKIKENPDYPFKPKTDKERTERAAFEKDRDDFIERMDKIRQENKKKDSESAEKKSPEKLLKEMGFETMEKVSFNGDKWEVAGVSLDSDGNAVGVNLTPDRQSGNLKSSNITVDDISKIKKEKLAEKKEDLQAALKEVEDAIDNAGDYDDVEELEKERQNLLKKLGKKPAETKKVPFGGVDKDDEGEGVEALSMADKINEVAEKGQLKVGNTTYKVDKDGKEWAVRTKIMNAIKCKEGIDRINDEFEKKAKPMLEAELKQRLDRIKEKLPEIVKEGKLEENKKLVEERLKRYSEGAGEGLTVDAVISNHKKDVINKLENHVKDNELFTQKNTDEIELLGNVDHQVELCSINTSAVFYAECKKLLDEYSEEESEAGKEETKKEKKGNVKKSLFDDLFEIDIIAADELEDEEELKENETEYNDYTAEQPDLFNSPEFAVREALNRRFNCR